MKCSECGKEIGAGNKFCGECGHPVPQERHCPSCGRAVAADAKFCGECGFRLINGVVSPAMSNPGSTGVSVGGHAVIAGDVVSHVANTVSGGGPSGIVGAQIGGHAVIGGNVVSNVTNNSFVVHDASKETVECGSCGRIVTVTETFACRVCGRQHLCSDHYSRLHNCCASCAAKIEAPDFTRKAIDAFAKGEVEDAVRLAQKAENENAEICYILGQGYELGKGVEKDVAKAANWYRRGAEKGNADAQNMLGSFYLEGTGVAQDDRQGVEWIRRAAENGNARAQCNLGSCYHCGRGVKEDSAQAVVWFRKAAEQGRFNAQHQLAECYANGWGVPVDLNEAYYWERQAGEGLGGDAQYEMGRRCELADEDEMPRAKVQALRWYLMAAQQGHAEAGIKVKDAVNLFVSGGLRWKMKWARMLIPRCGETEYLKSLTDDGELTKVLDLMHYGDYRSAMQILRTCNPEDRVASYCMYKVYGPNASSCGLARDKERSYQCLRHSAASGNVLAMNDLGWLCKDRPRRLDWLKRAADCGYEEALNNLIWFYRGGDERFVVDKDNGYALVFMRLGALLGSSLCASHLADAIGQGNVGPLEQYDSLLSKR